MRYETISPLLERKGVKHLQQLSKLCHLVGEGRNPIQNQEVPQLVWPCLGRELGSQV